LSSTFVEVAPGDFNITYAGGTGATGDYFADTLTIAGATLTGFNMAVATEVTGESEIVSVMGISYAGLESSNDGRTYTNYPVALVEQRITNTVAYSLWLDDLSIVSFYFIFSAHANMLLQPKAPGAYSSVVLIKPNSVAILKSLTSRISRSWMRFTSP
jgi:hypothetical protein